MTLKKNLSEDDTSAKFITPALYQAGWAEAAIRRQVAFTAGRIIVRGKLVTRGKAKRADYVLYMGHFPIALIEAKHNFKAAGDGMQQALDYATTLDIPFVFSSNGKGFVLHDRTGTSLQLETTLALDAFPSPAQLWSRYLAWKGLTPAQEQVVTQPYFDDGSGKEPRYYQRNAVNAAVQAIAKGQNRVLLVMATGTGKTYTAFQIIWRLWKAGQKKRILYLADRNILIDQTMVNDFRPFGGAMAKLSTGAKTIERADGTTAELTLALDKDADNKRRINTAYEIYLGLYQAITGPEERHKLFKEFSPGFFDLIVIDECHRGSAAEDSAWREILDYFAAATQIGMTATPKETEYVSNSDYFGPPVYTYSLKQGIRDGFLAPYKVIKVHLDVDVEGYRPMPGEVDQYGHEIEDRLYNQKDFDRDLIIDTRTARVAKWVSDYLKASGDRFQKTIVFCVDTPHAARMRQALINENADLVQKYPRYVMRITGDDAEVADRLAGRQRRGGIGHQRATTREDVGDRDIGGQTDRLVVRDHLIDADHRTVGGVVPRTRHHPDDAAESVGDRAGAAAVPRRIAHPRDRIDEAQRADRGLLPHLHPGRHRDAGPGRHRQGPGHVVVGGGDRDQDSGHGAGGEDERSQEAGQDTPRSVSDARTARSQQRVDCVSGFRPDRYRPVIAGPRRPA